MKRLLTILIFIMPLFSIGQTVTRDSSNGASLVIRELDNKIHMTQKGKKTVYELPNSFRGPVTIFKSEPCGQKTGMKKGKQVIKIPSNGILIIKDDRLDFSYDVNDGDKVFEYRPNIYFFVDSQNHKTELPELDHIKFDEGREQKYSAEDIGVFPLVFGSGTTYRPDTISYSFSELFVGSYKDLKSSNYQTDKIKKDKDAIDKLRKCRGL